MQTGICLVVLTVNWRNLLLELRNLLSTVNEVLAKLVYGKRIYVIFVAFVKISDVDAHYIKRPKNPDINVPQRMPPIIFPLKDPAPRPRKMGP